MPHATRHMPHDTGSLLTCHMPHITYHKTHDVATCHMPHATCHMTHDTCHMPHDTCHMHTPHDTYHISHATLHTLSPFPMRLSNICRTRAASPNSIVGCACGRCSSKRMRRWSADREHAFRTHDVTCRRMHSYGRSALFLQCDMCGCTCLCMPVYVSVHVSTLMFQQRMTITQHLV